MFQDGANGKLPWRRQNEERARMVEESTKRSDEAEKEQEKSLSREVEARKKRDRRGHIASVVSIIFFCIPVTLIVLWFLLCWYGFPQVEGEGDEGLAAIIGIFFGIILGTYLAFVTSIIGTSLGLYAVLSTKWRRGKVGLVLNLLLLLACCTCILLVLERF